MDAPGFDGLVRRFAARHSRRALVGGLAGTLAVVRGSQVPVAGKHKKPKKSAFCLNGQTLQASSKKKKKLRKQGATAGACCQPQCTGTTCGGSDGCGGTCGCAAGTVCHTGTCRACTVTCTGSDISCGLRLSQALEVGGEIFVCPGRYAGTFHIKGAATTLVGAGPGEDPASNTILDSRGIGSVVTVESVPASLSGLRVMGGRENIAAGDLLGAGNGIAAWGGDVDIDNFSIVDNRAQVGGGIVATKRLRLTHGTIERNIATEAGGGIFMSSGASSSIDDVYIAQNEAPKGGGLFVAANKLTILGCEISENRASNQGGGIYHQLGTLIFDDSVRVVENRATNAGGGIFVEDGTLQPNGAKVSDNTPNNCTGTTAC